MKIKNTEEKGRKKDFFQQVDRMWVIQ